MNTKDIQSLRKDYQKESLDESQVNSDPLKQFLFWFNEAISAQVAEPNAMTLSTVGADNRPSARIVLLKGVDSGFTFFTNYQSKKGGEIIENPNVALTFFWHDLERQVRIEGVAEKLSEEESDDYFSSRPVGSQIGAHASPQSQKIESRSIIEENLARLGSAFEGLPIPRPAHWGGFRVIPHYIEFWQGRSSRLHDRIVYQQVNGSWKVFRLAP